MTRDAKLYFLRHKDWKPLVDIVKNDNDFNLKFDVTIFQLMLSSSTEHHYAIISLSDKADKIIQDYGATVASKTDYVHNTLHDYNGEPLFGNKNNIAFLKKLE